LNTSTSKKAPLNNGCFLKFKNFLVANYGYFVIPLLVFALFTFALIFFGIWPFGTAIIASYDMLAQICPILEHFFDVFDGTSGLFHTFHLGGGMDMFGILAYCAVSPFTFLFLLGGQGNTVYMVSIVLPIKVACIAISAFIFLRRYFKSLPQYIQVFLALLYAYSGYMYVANTYIIWLDLMIYMPLLGAGIIEFSKTKSIRIMAISLALMIYTCFSIVCFSFFTLFPVLVCLILVLKKKEEWKEYLSKLCLAFVIAIGVSLPILVPSFVAYLQAGRNTGIFSRVFEIMSEKDLKKGYLNTHIYEKFTYILTDSIFVFLTVVYFLRSKRGDKRALFLVIAFVFLLLPLLVDESMLLLNMGSYYSYALRFGFLSSFFFLYVSALSIEEFLFDSDETAVIDKTKSSIAMAITMLLTVIGVVFTVYFFKYIINEEFKEDRLIEALFGAGNLAPFEDFFPCFAHSEGGLEGSAVLFVVVVLILALISVLLKFKTIHFKDVACFICILAVSQTVFYNLALVRGDKQSLSAQKFDYYKEMIDDLNDQSIYRIKNYGYYISSDSPIVTDSYSHTLFSSMADAKNITAPKFFEYGGSLTNSTRSNGGSLFSDSLFGYKYVVYSVGDNSAAKNNIIDESSIFNSGFLEETGVSAHRTPSLKVSKTVGDETKTVNWKNIDGELHGKDKWSKLKVTVDGKKFTGYLNGEKFLSVDMISSKISSISVTTKNAYGEVKNLTVKDRNGNEINGIWKTRGGFKEEEEKFISTENAGKVYFWGDLESFASFEGDVKFTTGTASDDFIGLEVTAKDENDQTAVYRLVIEPNVEYFIYRNAYAFPLVSVIENGELNFDAEKKEETYYYLTKLLNGGTPVFSMGTTSFTNRQIESIRDNLISGQVNYSLKKNSIVIEPFTAKKGQLLYLNYTNLKGYKAYVNGKEKPLLENGLDFMFVELDEGVNTVEIKYTSPYILYIAIGIFLAVAVVCACWIIYKKKPVIFEKVSVVLPYLAVGLAVGVTVFFFIFPTGVFFYKFFFKYLPILI